MNVLVCVSTSTYCAWNKLAITPNYRSSRVNTTEQHNLIIRTQPIVITSRLLAEERSYHRLPLHGEGRIGGPRKSTNQMFVLTVGISDVRGLDLHGDSHSCVSVFNNYAICKLRTFRETEPAICKKWPKCDCAKIDFCTSAQ